MKAVCHFFIWTSVMCGAFHLYHLSFWFFLDMFNIWIWNENLKNVVYNETR